MSRIPAVVIGAMLFSPLVAVAEESQTVEGIRELKQLMEQQMKRIDELTVEVGRLHQAVEAHRAALSPGPAPKRAVGIAPGYSGLTDSLRPAPSTPVVAPKAAPAAPAPAAAVPAPEETKEASNGVKHLVEKGETLTAIAKRYNVALPDLLKANKNVNDRKLQIGQTLLIPITAAPAPAKPADAPKPTEPLPSEKKENP